MFQSRRHCNVDNLWKPLAGDSIVLVIALIIAFLPFFRMHNNKSEYFVVEHNGTVLHKISANIDTVLNITTPEGSLVVKINGGKGAIVQSSCPNKICVHTGWIDKPGQSVICIPNKITLYISGKSDYDAILR